MDFVDLFPFAPEVGYLSLSLVNFFGSLIPFVPLPGFLLLATMSVGDQFDLHVLALLSAVTATVAKYCPEAKPGKYFCFCSSESNLVNASMAWS